MISEGYLNILVLRVINIAITGNSSLKYTFT